MEEAPDKGKELLQSAHANGMNEDWLHRDTNFYKNTCKVVARILNIQVGINFSLIGQL
jgi:hypothetical protein